MKKSNNIKKKLWRCKKKNQRVFIIIYIQIEKIGQLEKRADKYE